MEQRVREILESAFPGIEVNTEVRPDGRIAGSIVWVGFERLDDVDRQNRVRAVLQQELGEEAKKVGILLTYTPNELKRMRAA